MRMRIISVVVVLGLGVVGITRAQQPGERDKAKLSAQVVKLRVEIELLELDHDADRAHLLDMMKGIRKYEASSPEQVRQAVAASMYFRMPLEESREGQEGRTPDVDETIKKEVEAARAFVNRKRKDYAKQATELAEKRLKLEEAEKQYRKAE